MSSIEVFQSYYKEQKEILNSTILEFNNHFIEENNSIIRENLEYFKDLNSDGKLVRGMLVNLGYSLLKDDALYSNYLALAYEVFQTAILVHDDIIDKDDKRRGKETVHYRNYNKYKDYSLEEAKHLSNSIGICMGDYGLYSANKIISDNYQDNPNLGKVLSYFNSIVLKTIKGELLDVILPFQSKNIGIENDMLDESIMNIYRLKTSYYTIIGPLCSGLILAGADDKKIQDMKEFGEKIGIAFQIQDDILGVYSDEMGKVKGSDIREFKQTILYSHICRTEYKDEIHRYYGVDDLTVDVIDKVKELFELSGSLYYAESMMNQMYNDGLDILNRIDWIDDNKKDILRGFVEYLRKRKK